MIVEAGKSEIYSRGQQFGNLRVNVSDLILKSSGQAGRLETKAGFLCCCSETKFLFFMGNFSFCS